MNLSLAQRYLLSLLSGILMVISFPYTGSLTPFIFLAWVPLLLIEDNLTTIKAKSIHFFPHAYLSLFIFNLGTTWWIWNSTEVGGILAFVFNTLLMAFALQLFHVVKKQVGNTFGYAGFILIWTAFEYLHFNWELSWPWLSMGDFFSIQTNWIQWYEYTGVLGGTIWVLLLNLSFFLLLKRFLTEKKKTRLIPNIAGILALIAVPLFISHLLIPFPTKGGPHTEIVVVQPNIDPYNEKFSENSSVEDQLGKFFALAGKVTTENTDLILGPETVISRGFFEQDLTAFPFYQQIALFRKNHPKTEVLLGASSACFYDYKRSVAAQPFNGGFYESYNSSLFVHANSKNEFIHKSKLVLGVEKIPFSETLPFLESLAIDNGGTSGTLGIEDAPKIFKGKSKIAPIVCYESIYGEFVSKQSKLGAQVLCILTNDGWWKDTPGYKQHFSFARLRAIENRKWVVRSANTGKSGVISPSGEVIKETGWWVEDVFRCNVPLFDTQTFYVKHGDYLGKGFLAVSYLLVGYAIFVYTRKKLRLKKALKNNKSTH